MLESKATTPSEDSANTPKPGEDRTLSPGDKRLAIAAMLEGKTAGQADQGNQDDQDGKPAHGEDQQKGGKLDSLEAVAERLGVDVSSLYSIAIKQPGSGEDRVTLGQLADLAKDKGRLELDRLEFDENKSKREADLMRAQQELNELIALLPRQAIKPELLDAVQRKMTQSRDRERVATLSTIPEWKNEQLEKDDRKAMSEHLAAYGFAANYLEQVQDHRTLKYIRDNWQRQRNMDRALQALKSKRPDGQRPGAQRSPGKKPTDAPARRNVSRDRQSQVEAVAELLRGN